MVTYLGSLVRSCCGEGGTLQTNIAGMWGECPQCLGCTDVAPLMACVPSWSTLLRLKVALPGNCLRWALGCAHFPGLSHSGSGSWDSTKAQSWLGLPFVPFPGPSSSGDRVLGERSLPRRGVHLITSPVPAAQFPGWQRVHPSQVCCVSLLGSWSLAATLPADVNSPKSQ